MKEKKETMAKCVALEKSIYRLIYSTPFASIPSKLMWAQKELLNEEVKVAALEINVSSTWTGEYRLHAKICGARKYLVSTGLARASITSSLHSHCT